jgi:hypothetical protein
MMMTPAERCRDDPPWNASCATRIRNLRSPIFRSLVRPAISPTLSRCGPLPAGRAETAIAIIVFVRDPAKGNVAATSILREVLGLTEAEADLAPALQSAISMTD